MPVGQPGPMTPGDFPRAKLLPGGEYVHPDGHITLFLRDVCRLLCIENGHSSYLEDFGDDPEAIVTGAAGAVSPKPLTLSALSVRTKG